MRRAPFQLPTKETIKDDVVAGLIVAIVALPLALGFSIASNVPPAMGVYTAIIAGFFAALFGGSDFQISGPTGAMVVVVLSVVSKFGIDGLILATLLAGAILVLAGLLRLGKVIEYIPSPVIVGFTAGIAAIIFLGQLNNFFGIQPIYSADAGFISKTAISIAHIIELTWPTFLLGALTLLILIITPKISRRIPGSIIAVVTTTLLTLLLPGYFLVKTVSDIGAIPSGLPLPHLPVISWNLALAILPAALTVAALAAIESLLSAVVADSLTDTRHKPNKELVGQGIANIASALFGGMPATGAIARTATNIRNGGKTRFAAMTHAIFLLIFILIAAPLAGSIPLGCLAGILMFVSFNMVEWERIRLLLKTPLSDITVMITTFLITVMVDLTTAIEVGLVLAALLFMKRMSDLYHIESVDTPETNTYFQSFSHPDISIYTVHGPLFFGAASRFDQRVATMPGGHKRIKILRLRYVPVIDATGLNFLHATYNKHRKIGGVVLFANVHPDVMRIMRSSGLYQMIGAEHFFANTKQAIAHALKHAHRLHGEPEIVTDEELGRYQIQKMDLEDAAPPLMSKDADPVQQIFDAIGIGRLGTMSTKTIKHTIHGTKTIFPPKEQFNTKTSTDDKTRPRRKSI
ncbi:MAG: SulP family inorganic anion transporter [Nanoarchaeota archaeon]